MLEKKFQQNSNKYLIQANNVKQLQWLYKGNNLTSNNKYMMSHITRYQYRPEYT